MLKKIAERTLLIVETALVSTHLEELSAEMKVLTAILVATVIVTATIAEHTRKTYAIASSEAPRTTAPEPPSKKPLWDRSKYF